MLQPQWLTQESPRSSTTTSAACDAMVRDAVLGLEVERIVTLEDAGGAVRRHVQPPVRTDEEVVATVARDDER